MFRVRENLTEETRSANRRRNASPNPSRHARKLSWNLVHLIKGAGLPSCLLSSHVLTPGASCRIILFFYQADKHRFHKSYKFRNLFVVPREWIAYIIL